MFDQLTESNTPQNEPKNRRSYFVVTGLLVGAFFLSGVVWSLYGKNLVLGSGDMELSSMVSPVTPPENAPRPPEPRPQRQQAAPDPDTTRTTRQTNMLRIEEHTAPPTGISVTPNTGKARTSDSIFDRYAVEKTGGTAGSTGSGRTTGPTGPETGSNEGGPLAENNVPEPPPNRKIEPPATPKKERRVSGGVVNGKAIDLPVPAYTAAARAIGASGLVNVAVTIDESGRVTSANAVSGHMLLRQPAEKAAKSARFRPTMLTDEPVKVTGVIVYNFKP